MSSSQADRDPRLWGALLGSDTDRRMEAARTLRALEVELAYAWQLLNALPSLQAWQRANAGDALALLGDPRFSPPYYVSEMIGIPAGEAILGDSRYREERPAHSVHVDGF